MSDMNREPAQSIEELDAAFQTLLAEFARIDSELRDLRRIVHGSEIRPSLLDSLADPPDDESDDAWFDRMSGELVDYLNANPESAE